MPTFSTNWGVRHAVRPGCTVLLFANQSRLAFDVEPLRAMPYRLSGAGVPAVGCITHHFAGNMAVSIIQFL
jgi:hypothetical protein